MPNMPVRYISGRATPPAIQVSAARWNSVMELSCSGLGVGPKDDTSTLANRGMIVGA